MAGASSALPSHSAPSVRKSSNDIVNSISNVQVQAAFAMAAEDILYQQGLSPHIERGFLVMGRSDFHQHLCPVKGILVNDLQIWYDS